MRAMPTNVQAHVNPNDGFKDGGQAMKKKQFNTVN